ncbi:MAG: HAMP domain-containing histidine kinase [Deltaproteobacteria bacterium]|nr:HAMP domain-containing histidine kinase [Deltaproteobacteria bacterium]
MPQPRPSSQPPETCFLPAPRASEAALRRLIERVAANPVIDAVLSVAGGLVAVLNAERQILAVNHAYLARLGVADPGATLGLRPGESLGCVHAHDRPGGCGTGPACASCGAAIAMLAASESRRPAERECVLTIDRDGRRRDLCMRARAVPIAVEGVSLLLLFLEDITDDKRRAGLERAFFHDLRNTLGALLGTTEQLEVERPPGQAALAREVRSLTRRLARELEVHRALSVERGAVPRRRNVPVPLDRVVAEAADAVAHHPAARDRRVRLPAMPPHVELRTEPVLLQRVLANMLLNALEATPPGGEVRLETSVDGSRVAFLVWNAAVIPASVVPRVFQRYFSTKEGLGRGQGTWAMKLLGETHLGGRVEFTTSEADGTVFRLTLPLDGPAPPPEPDLAPGNLY